MAAARGLLEDWNNGKIKYYTLPPEQNENEAHISSAVVSEVAKEFDLANFESMEMEVLNTIEKDFGTADKSFVLDSMGSVNAIEEMEEDTHQDNLVNALYNDFELHNCFDFIFS